MYLYMNNVVGKNTINLPLPIDKRDRKLEIAIINFLKIMSHGISKVI